MMYFVNHHLLSNDKKEISPNLSEKDFNPMEVCGGVIFGVGNITKCNIGH